MSDHYNSLPGGCELEGYRIDRVLGVGGFGITYLAEDVRIGKAVAIKEYLPNEFAVRAEASTVLPKSSADTADFNWGLERFLDEARTLATFDHPHLNKVLRFFDANGTAYMVLDYIEGETLSARLKRDATLPVEELERLIAALASGLDVVHQAGFVHRDIKPGNIMLRSDGTPVLLDFGAARVAMGQRSKSITAILTPGYAPVEQYDQTSDDIGPWTDIYALGMVAYRCISGLTDSGLIDSVARARLLRKGQQDQDLQRAVELGQGRYPQRLLEGIDAAIEVNEEERPQSIGAWLPMLFGDRIPLTQVQTTVSVAAPAGAGPATGAPGGARKPLWIAVAAGVVVLVALAVFLGGGGESGDTRGEEVADNDAQSPAPEATPAVVETAPRARPETSPPPAPAQPVPVQPAPAVVAKPAPQPRAPVAALSPEDRILEGLDIDAAAQSARVQNLTGAFVSYIKVKSQFETCVKQGCAQMMTLKSQLDNVRQVSWRNGGYDGLLRLRGVSRNNPDCRWRMEVYERLQYAGGGREQERTYCTGNGLTRKLESAGAVKSL